MSELSKVSKCPEVPEQSVHNAFIFACRVIVGCILYMFLARQPFFSSNQFKIYSLQPKGLHTPRIKTFKVNHFKKVAQNMFSFYLHLSDISGSQGFICFHPL